MVIQVTSTHCPLLSIAGAQACTEVFGLPSPPVLSLHLLKKPYGLDLLLRGLRLAPSFYAFPVLRSVPRLDPCLSGIISPSSPTRDPELQPQRPSWPRPALTLRGGFTASSEVKIMESI